MVCVNINYCSYVIVLRKYLYIKFFVYFFVFKNIFVEVLKIDFIYSKEIFKMY